MSLEESVRDNKQVGVELEMTIGRLKQENCILEERKKVILDHLHTPQSSPRGTSPQVLVSQACSVCACRVSLCA